MDVRSSTAGFVDIDADHPFAKGISPRHYHCGPKTQSDFREQYHVPYPFPSPASCARCFPASKLKYLLLNPW